MARLSPLVPSDVVELRCPYCGRQVPASTDWVNDAQRQWGRCGVKLATGGRTVAVLMLAPTQRTGQAMVKGLWVQPDLVGHGYGRQLVQAAAAEMLRLRLDVILAAAADGRHSSCATPPAGFLERVGFVRPPNSALWRLDLAQAVLERSGLGVVGRFLRGLGLGPQPAGGAAAGRTSSGR